MVAPRCPGSASPWPTMLPSPSQIEAEKSMFALTSVEREVRSTDTIMLSEIITSAFLISSRRIGSMGSDMAGFQVPHFDPEV